MKLTKEQEEKMAGVLKEVMEKLGWRVINDDDDDSMQYMVEKVFGEIKDDDEWVLCCNELVARILSRLGVKDPREALSQKQF